MKLWADFHPYVLPDVEGCPEPLLDQVLIETSRHFCTKTKAWKEWLSPIVATGLTQRYTFAPTAGSEVVSVLRATVGDEEYAIRSPINLPVDWMETAKETVDNTIIHISATEFMIYPLPVAGTLIQMEVAMRPTLAATGIADAVFDEFQEAISAGTKARLLKKPNKPWTDLQTAGIEGMAYIAQTNSAANKDWRLEGLRQVTIVD